ncbi:MAG: hypothetical protein DVB35_04085 [Verrucomicrobia bacterium]|jgi:hypothetical protein|nr:MAG: hypothetical protein DVB35_04085 [Verrucomicrobiota bacterium]
MNQLIKLCLLISVLTLGSSALNAASNQAAKNNYPLTTCVVSGDDLQEMGHPFTYIHKEEGKADRTVIFCCKNCVDDFKKDPKKYLAILDAAEMKAKK